MRSGIGKAAAVKMATFFAMLKNGEIADLKTKPVNKKDNTISKRAKHPNKSNLEIESEPSSR